MNTIKSKLFSLRRVYSSAIICILFMAGSFAAENKIELQFTEQEKQWLAQHPVIRISPDSNYEPAEFVSNNKHSGMNGDYFKLFSDMLGVEFLLVPHKTWAESLVAMDEGRTDVLSLVQATPERRKKYSFTEPFMALNTVIITDKVPGEDFVDIDSLKGKKIAVVKGYFWEELVKTEYPSIEVVPVQSIEAGLTETALGTVDAFLGSFVTSSYYISKQEITNLRVSGKAPYQINYGAAVRKDWPELVSMLNKAISAISQDQHEEIRNRWISLDYEPPLVGRSIALILIALFVLFTLMMLVGAVWVKTLRRKVQEKTTELIDVNLKLEHTVENRTQDLRRANDKLLSSRRILATTNEQLTDEINRDSLTQIPNRKKMHEFLERAWQSAQENSEPLSLILADIDHFKLLNDHYGHLIGDDCLREVAACLQSYTKRGGEFVARFGGEEFILVLPKLNESEALEYAGLLVEKIHSLNIENVDSPIGKLVTISMGVASFDPGDKKITQKQLIDQSDKALYKAKELGRNRAVCYSSLS